MKVKILLSLLTVLCITLVATNIYSYRKIEQYEARTVKVLDCSQQHDEFVSLWCTAKQSFANSDLQEKSSAAQESYINGWFHTINQILSSATLGSTITAPKTSTPSPTQTKAWIAGNKTSAALIDNSYLEMIYPHYKSGSSSLLDKFFSMADSAYNQAELPQKDLYDKNQYLAGFLTGRVLGLEQPHNLSELTGSKNLEKYSQSLVDTLLADTTISPVFHQGVVDGVRFSVKQLQQEINASIHAARSQY